MGMKERVNLLGGSFVIESVPGEGTTIRVIIPLSEESYADTDLHSG
jgi:signal transduction histidine kinase